MWPFTKITARQREIRKNLTGRSAPWWRRLSAAVDWRVTSLTVAAIVVSGLILNLGGDTLLQREGEMLQRPIVARVTVTVPDPDRTKDKRNEARLRSPAYYVLDRSLVELVRGRLMNAVNAARALQADPDRLRAEASKDNLFLSDEALAEILRLTAESEGEVWRQVFSGVINALIEVPLVEVTDQSRRLLAAEAALVDPDNPDGVRLVPIIEYGGQRSLRFANNPEDVRFVAARAAAVVVAPLRPGVERMVLDLLMGETEGGAPRPVYRYDPERTTRAARAAADAVPLETIVYPEGTILADAGPIDHLEYRRLEFEHEAYLASRGAASALLPLRDRGVLGRCALALLVVLGLFSYMVFQRSTLGAPIQQTLAVGVLLALLVGARAAFVAGPAPPTLAFGFQALAAAVLTIVFPRGPVFATCAALATLITLAIREETPLLICLLAASGPFVMLLSDVRSRGVIVRVGVLAAGLAFVTVCAVGLTKQQALAFAVRDAAWAAGATLLAAFVAEGLLPIIERAFRVSTSMTLLEWCDSSKPLLRMMAADAPGTYNHSLLVGTLAQSAAEAIGANGLLCRAGSLYHDIGKINKPEYFVENQTPGVSRHERLSPAMSLLIIVGHVKDGVEMARQYRLPQSLRPVIAEHHGTTIVEYFYHAANKLRKPGDPEVAEAQFRYPGPKPQSRETAIVMLCDGVEGAVRAMTEPTPGRIESVVSEIVQKRLLDGQFDECDLTFRELAIVERSLVRSLSSLYHARIAYPESEKKADARGEPATEDSRIISLSRTSRS